tara:strand:+ start:2090 stop:2509 length:420 start_codon:yes stop_codon:yes gene_type:complete
MFSIGQLSKRTRVKVPTIRYYESIGLITAADRTEGNQRRYGQAGLAQLVFIKHARDLGFSIDAISSLMVLQSHPDRTCAEATDIARAQLSDVRDKIRKLVKLEAELDRVTTGCDGDGLAGECYVLAALADHQLCDADHT